MSTDNKGLVERLRGFASRHYNAERVQMASDAADALEALAGERNTATANLKGLQQQVRDLVAERDRLKEAIERNAQNCIDTMNKMHEQHAAERDRLKAVLKPRLNAKAIEGLQEILEAMEAMDEREAPFLKTLLDWHEAARKALGDAS